MALKSSQPRRSASPKSERSILRTTNPVATPNSCSLGLAKYVVAMVRSPSSGSRTPKSRASASCAKIAIEPGKPASMKGALPDRICRDRCSKLSAVDARKRSRFGELCNCTDLHVTLYSQADQLVRGCPSSIRPLHDLLTPGSTRTMLNSNAPSSDEVAVVATGLMGEARATTVA